ncbi:MAG: MBL fold metallo-hydrolase [Clostridia bacterium]|nr:MBL fold metallo-hydrolase [Clostridia bacterium]
MFGKNTLLPYLLDRGIVKIDYIMISHFDLDHIQGLLYVMQKIKVKNVIIGKQFETCDNYEQFVRLVKENKIKVSIVEAEQKINIEKDLYFSILWPDSKNKIDENMLNNNSLVCKLLYKDFSMMFTGDIEEVAEKELLNKYKDTSLLKATVLKIPHHGSKSSSTEQFIKQVESKIAIIRSWEK